MSRNRRRSAKTRKPLDDLDVEWMLAHYPEQMEYILSDIEAGGVRRHPPALEGRRLWQARMVDRTGSPELGLCEARPALAPYIRE